MNAQVQKYEAPETAVAAKDGEGAAIFQIIARLASDPTANPERIERFLAMRDKEIERIAKLDFDRAMKAAQAEMEPVSADAKNTQTKSKYATYAALDRALRPIYTKHGFSLSFDEADCPKEDHIRVLCYVAHEGGHTRTYRKDMPADGKGAKGGDVMTKTHAAGAAASYGQRYLLKGIFNVAVGEDDADGNVPSETVTSAQRDQLQELIEATATDTEAFCKHFRIDGLPNLPLAKYGAAIAALQAKKAKMGATT